MFFQKLTLATVAAYALQSTAADSIFGIANSTADFSTLAAAVGLAGLTDTLSGDGALTVFAPQNSAFTELPADLLNKLLDPTWQPQLADVIKYHAIGSKVLAADLTDGMTVTTLSGANITINLDPTRVNEDAMVILADVLADNGVVHGIDKVLTPASVSSSIVDIAAGDDVFSTLVEAVTAADLVDVLSGDGSGPLTVFAPTNEAFAALPAGTLESLLLPENKDKLIDILKYHVVAANALSSSLTSTDLETLEGDTVAIDLSGAGVKVNDADVVIADIIASNGIIHVINKVLLPPDDTNMTVTDPTGMTATDPTKPDLNDSGDITDAPTKKPTSMPTTSGAFSYGTAVAVVAIATGVMYIA